MKPIYKLILATCLLLPYCVVQGQVGQGVPSPDFHWKCTSADSLLNFHPATITPLQFDSVPFSKDYTMIVVYKPVTDTEATVWQLVFADSSVRGLTTERIISDSSTIRYADPFGRDPVIHTLRQSAPDLSSPDVSLSVGDGNIKVSEVLYFNHRLSTIALRRVQSALAIRYGITLGPVDYIGGSGDHVWQHRRDSALFHHRITGIGNDTACGLHQLRSRSEVDGAIVTLAADSLPQGAYILIGDNDAPLTFQLQDGDIETCERQWCVQLTGAKDAVFSLSFDTHGIPIPTDSLVLILGGDLVLPSVSTANEVCFNGLMLPSDTCVFGLARGTLLWQLAQSGAKDAKSHGNTTANKSADTDGLAHSDIQAFSLYPNPTTGHFNIEVSGASQVQITIYSLQGKVMATYGDRDRDRYCFEGSLPSGNIYYASISTENSSQTMKLVVK